MRRRERRSDNTPASKCDVNGRKRFREVQQARHSRLEFVLWDCRIEPRTRSRFPRL